MKIDATIITLDSGEELQVTKEQSTSLLRVIGRYGKMPDRLTKGFAEDVLLATFLEPNITIGIEEDGYAHS